MNPVGVGRRCGFEEVFGGFACRRSPRPSVFNPGARAKRDFQNKRCYMLATDCFHIIITVVANGLTGSLQGVWLREIHTASRVTAGRARRLAWRTGRVGCLFLCLEVVSCMSGVFAPHPQSPVRPWGVRIVVGVV